MSKSGELICAIEELEQFIQANDEAIGDDAMAPAKELDARIYALATSIGVNVPTLTAEFRQPFHAFGHTAIPVIQFRGGLIKLFALDSWKQSMAGLKETARLVGQPFAQWDDDRPVTSADIVDRLVERHGLNQQDRKKLMKSIDGRLSRWRSKHPDGVTEIVASGSRSATYQYCWGDLKESGVVDGLWIEKKSNATV